MNEKMYRSNVKMAEQIRYLENDLSTLISLTNLLLKLVKDNDIKLTSEIKDRIYNMKKGLYYKKDKIKESEIFEEEII